MTAFTCQRIRIYKNYKISRKRWMANQLHIVFSVTIGLLLWEEKRNLQEFACFQNSKPPFLHFSADSKRYSTHEHVLFCVKHRWAHVCAISHLFFSSLTKNFCSTKLLGTLEHVVKKDLKQFYVIAITQKLINRQRLGFVHKKYL